MIIFIIFFICRSEFLFYCKNLSNLCTFKIVEMIKKSFMSILLKNNHKNRTFFYRYTFLLYKSNCLSSSLLKINLLTNKSQVCTFVHHCTQFVHQCTHFLYTMLNYFQRRNNVRRMSQLLTFEQTSKLIRFPNSVFHHLGM